MEPSPPKPRRSTESDVLQHDGASHGGDADNKAGEKSSGLLKSFGNFRMSRRSMTKPSEAEEQSSPEKIGFSLNFRASKKVLKRQSQVEEPNSPETKEPFAQLGLRLSKIYQKKTEIIDEKGSPDKKDSPGTSSSLVTKIRSSMKAKKKIDFNEHEGKKEGAVEESEVEEKTIDKPLSVMEINGLIQTRELHRAFRSIVSKEEKLIEEIRSKNYHENITDFTIRARDVDLLYTSLSNTLRSIVKETLHRDPVDEDLVASLVDVIEKEAIIHLNTNADEGTSDLHLGQPRRWKHLWREAVKDSVTRRLESVPLNTRDPGWLSNHLDKLRTDTLEDLIKVKNVLTGLYPEDYRVCSTYLQSFHDAISSHIQRNVVSQALTLSQLFCLLDWIINKYKSAEFMEDPELQPEMMTASLPPLLQGESLEKLQRDYKAALQERIKTYMRNLLEMEKNKWEKGEETDEETLKDTSLLPLYTDIEHIIGTHVRESAKLSEELEKSAVLICVEQLGSFSTRLQDSFSEWSADRFSLLSVQYFVYYTNSLLKLRHNTAQGDSEHCRTAEAALNTATEHFKKLLFHLFTRETKPHFQKLISKSWLRNGSSFGAIMKSVELLGQYVKYLIAPHDKEMARRVHKHLVKEYMTQIMRRKLSLSPLKRKKAAQRMNDEGDLFNRAAEEMGSDQDGLYRVIHCISEIIGAKRKEEIRPHLDVLYQLYPDVSEEHILCILHLHGIGHSKKLLQHFHNLQNNNQPEKEPEDKLFSEIECATRVTCFPRTF